MGERVRNPALVIGLLLFLAPIDARADGVLSATTEDLSQFEAVLAHRRDNENAPAKQSSAHTKNFGAMVSAEAKKLRDNTGNAAGSIGQTIGAGHGVSSSTPVSVDGQGNTASFPPGLTSRPPDSNAKDNGKGNGNAGGDGHGHGNPH